MKIPDYLNVKISEAYLRQSQAAQRKNTATRTQAASRSTPAHTSGRSRGQQKPRDEIILSSHATEAREFEAIARVIPEIRQDKVDAVRTQVESKAYSVNGKLVAKSIIELLG